MTEDDAHAEPVLEAWGIRNARLTPITTGHINATYRVDAPGSEPSKAVLQSLSPIFDPKVCEDVQAVTSHLAARGIPTPRLIRSLEGACSVQADGRTWRLLSWVEGQVFTRIPGPAEAEEAGRALGTFHRGLADLRTPFAASRLGVHDTAAHLARLGRALETHGDHPLHGRVRPLAEDILDRGARRPDLPDGPMRVVHGDPKIANLIFTRDPEPKAVAWVDLDTVARMPLAVELGDALRSWCNRSEEDAPPEFDLQVFESALRGYVEATRGFLTASEAADFVDATATIALELAARFCRDALEESYFGWDRSRFGRAGEHHLARTQAQLALHRRILDRADAARGIVAAAFPSG